MKGMKNLTTEVRTRKGMKDLTVRTRNIEKPPISDQMLLEIFTRILLQLKCDKINKENKII